MQNNILSVSHGARVSLVNETEIRGKISDCMKILLCSKSKIHIFFEKSKDSQSSSIKDVFLFDTNLNVRSIDCYSSFLLV